MVFVKCFTVFEAFHICDLIWTSQKLYKVVGQGWWASFCREIKWFARWNELERVLWSTVPVCSLQTPPSCVSSSLLNAIWSLSPTLLVLAALPWGSYITSLSLSVSSFIEWGNDCSHLQDFCDDKRNNAHQGLIQCLAQSHILGNGSCQVAAVVRLNLDAATDKAE